MSLHPPANLGHIHFVASHSKGKLGLVDFDELSLLTFIHGGLHLLFIYTYRR